MSCLGHGQDYTSNSYSGCRWNFLSNCKLFAAILQIVTKSGKSPQRSAKHPKHCRSSWNFFISRVLKNREKDDGLRQGYFNKIVWILRNWIDYKPTNLQTVTDPSLSELYLCIMEELQSRSENRYNQIRKHLEDANYKEEYSSLTNSEQRESKHNAAVGMFVDKTNKTSKPQSTASVHFYIVVRKEVQNKAHAITPLGL